MSRLLDPLTDPQILALTLYGEARGEPIEGVIAVGCVIRNRVIDARWGTKYRQVCLAPWQFSCWRREGGEANYERVLDYAKQLLAHKVPDDPIFRQCVWVSQGVIGGWILDTVKNATHYYAPAAMQPPGSVPKWAANKQPVVTRGRHVFYADVE